jgi:hypothetical protein
VIMTEAGRSGSSGEVRRRVQCVLTDSGITTVITGIRVPRMNAIMERWVRTCRTELLDRTLIYNQRHLLHALAEYESFYNQHRPHRTLQHHYAHYHHRPLNPSDCCSIVASTGMIDSAAFFTNTISPPDQHGWSFRHLQGRPCRSGPSRARGLGRIRP